MNTERPTQERITEWLRGEETRRLPGGVLDAAFARTRASAQVRARASWRSFGTFPRTGIVIAAAAVVALGILSVALRPGSDRRSVGGPVTPTSPAPVTSAAPSPTPCEAGTAIGIPFRSGCRYASISFRPTLSIDGDARWTDTDETARGIQIDARLPGGVPRMEGVGFANIDRLASRPCQASGDMTDQSTVPFRPTSPGSGPADLFKWIGQKTPLKAPSPTPTSIAGFPGLVTTVTIPVGALEACGGRIWISQVAANPYGGHWALALSGLTLRIAAIDVHGTTILVSMWAPPERFPFFEPEAAKLLASASFE